jgi:hypothetical protein
MVTPGDLPGVTATYRSSGKPVASDPIGQQNHPP